MGEYINVVVIDLPHTVRGFVRRNEDGGYTIFLNARLSQEMQFDAYLHELAHIFEGDFDLVSVQTIEAVAHNRCNGDALRNVVV